MPARSKWAPYCDQLVRQLSKGANEVYQTIAEIKAGGCSPMPEDWVASEWNKAVKGDSEYATASKRGLLLHPHYGTNGQLVAITFRLAR